MWRRKMCSRERSVELRRNDAFLLLLLLFFFSHFFISRFFLHDGFTRGSTYQLSIKSYFFSGLQGSRGDLMIGVEAGPEAVEWRNDRYRFL